MGSNGQIAPIYIIIKKWKWMAPDQFSLDKVSVFIGKVSPQIQKELNSFTKNYKIGYQNAQLDKFFGKNFVKSLTDLLSQNKTGGDDDLITIDDIFATTDEQPIPIDFEQSDMPQPPPKDENQPTITEILATKPIESAIAKSAPKIQIGNKVELEFINQTIWSIETPMDLREKIWTYLGVPMFCQYLSVKSESGDITPLYYNIYNNNKLVRLNLPEIIMTPEKYNGLPILDHYYAFRDFFFIQTLDNFEILEKFANYVSNSLIVDLYDSRQFLGKLNLSALEKDKNMQQLLYFGFFILFWPMMTEDVFHEYIAHSGNLTQLAKLFPELLPRVSDHMAANEKEYEMFNLFYTLTESGTAGDKKILSELERNLYMRMSKNTIVNYSYGDNKQIIISLRNLFDQLVLTDHIVAIKYSTLHLDQRIEMHKTYKTTKELHAPISLNSLLVRCILTDTQKHVFAKNKESGDIKHVSQNIFDVNFYENGNYSVKCIWGETTHYTFDQAIKLVSEFINTKLIASINKMKGTVMHQMYSLLPISPSIVGFSNISAEIYYRKNLSTRDLHLFRYVLRDMYEAKLLTADLSSHEDDFNLTYYLWKGNYQQDRDLLHKKYLSIANTYEYLTKASVNTKWNQIYVRNKAINIALRPTDIKFTLSGIWDKEFNIAYSYILLALYLLHTNAVRKYAALITKEDGAKKKSEHNVKSLKQIDPVLYDFKRYNSNLVYSKICQRPNQPQILSMAEYKALPEKEKEKVIKYWNFTTETEAYYYAPNPKYPYINFIVGKHPLNFCIPCAKKTSYARKSNIKHQIYDACMTAHAYEKGRKNMIVETRYIMNYGKPIEPGRLCKLPENTLEPLFYESFYENAGFDEECYQSDKYFIVGVSQEYEGIAAMGIFNCVLLTLETTMKEFIGDIKKRILAKPTLFNILLNGQILNDFYDYREFIDIISKIFLTSTLVELEWQNLNWTAIIIDILFYYFDIVVVEFRDAPRHEYLEAQQSKGDSSMATNLEEIISGDFVELQVNQRLDVILGGSSQYQYLLVLTKKRKVNPIYMVNPVVYFKSKVIGKKIFESTSAPISILSKLLLHIKRQSTHKTATNYYSTIEALDEFVKQSRDYAITTYYINTHNQCYYVGIKGKGNRLIYMPVAVTNWAPKNGIKVIYDTYIYNGKMDIKSLNEFLTHYNKWIIGLAPNSTAGIRIEKWIETPSAKICGFMYGAINYYFNDISAKVALAIKSAPIWKMPYTITEINRQIAARTPIKTDPLVANITASFYENHIYQLLLLEFTSMLMHEKNIKLRMELKKIIISLGKESLVDIFDKLMKSLDKYYVEFQSENEEANAIWTDLKLQDYNRLIDHINVSITKFIDKNEMLQYMDQSVYNFDKMTINRFKSMSHDQIKRELTKMAGKITQAGPIPKTADIPNLLVACSTGTAFYCKKSKLIIPEKKLNKLLDILAADIQNPMKEKWIFTPLFTDYIINFLKFEQRPLETITIDLV